MCLVRKYHGTAVYPIQDTEFLRSIYLYRFEMVRNLFSFVKKFMYRKIIYRIALNILKLKL